MEAAVEAAAMETGMASAGSLHKVRRYLVDAPTPISWPLTPQVAMVTKIAIGCSRNKV
jgi:hypothetical protein